MKHPRIGGNWRMVLTTENDVDQLTVEVETKTLLSKNDVAQLTHQIQSEIKSVLVFNPRIAILPPNSIPETGLKAKRVIDNRAH
jgi:phenylacetate-coenzyme A ligase PaaK-like adenylate-forming protein